MNQDNWYLKETKNLNRMLKMRDDKDLQTENFSQLLTITHKYTTRDDVLFPELSTLAFFAAFEEKILANLEKLQEIVYVINDVDHGLFNIYIYTKDAQKTIYDSIEYFKGYPTKKVDFHIQNDPQWTVYKQFKDL